MENNCIGQLVLLKEENETGILFLYLDDKRTYPISKVQLVNQDFSGKDLVKSFPKPWIINKAEEVIEVGAKVLVTFPLHDRPEIPFVTGTINSLGNQFSLEAGFRLDSETMNEVRSFKQTDNFTYDESLAENGFKKIVISNGTFSISVIGDNAAISLQSENAITIEARQILRMLGMIVEVGGNYDKENQENIRNTRAKEVNLNADIVNIGYSPERFPDLKMDAVNGTTSVDTPKLQPMLMGITAIMLIKKGLEIIYDAEYIGPNGPVQMSIEDKAQLQLQVIDKLENALSQSGNITKNKDVKD